MRIKTWHRRRLWKDPAYAIAVFVEWTRGGIEGGAVLRGPSGDTDKETLASLKPTSRTPSDLDPPTQFPETNPLTLA